jgi:hypothetical protein
VLFDYIPTPPSTLPRTDLPNALTENKSNTELKIIESDNNSSLIITRSEKLIDKNELQQHNQLTITNHNRNLSEPKRRSPRRSSSKKRTFALYPNDMSDWDSTDSEPGINETNGNYGEPETCQTHF